MEEVKGKQQKERKRKWKAAGGGEISACRKTLRGKIMKPRASAATVFQ